MSAPLRQARTVRGGRARRMLAVARKEVLQVMRDPSSIIVAFVLPLVLIFIFGFALSLDNDEIAIDLVMEDTAPDALSLTRAFVNSRYFRVEDVLRHRGEAQARLAAGKVRGIVVIPQNFSLRLRTDGRPAELQVIADGSEPNTAAFVNNYAGGVLDAWMRVRGILEGERVGHPSRSRHASGTTPRSPAATFWCLAPSPSS